MPRLPNDTSRWLVLGRLLPRRVRERIFEPAFHDLLRRAIESRRDHSGWFAVGAVGVFAGSFAIAVRRLLLTRGVLVLAGVLLVMLMLVTLLDWFGHLYAS